MVPTNTGLFLHCLKLWRESRTLQVLLVSKEKIGGNHAFFRDKKALILNEMPYIALYFTVVVVTPKFLSGFHKPLLRSAFPA